MSQNFGFIAVFVVFTVVLASCFCFDWSYNGFGNILRVGIGFAMVLTILFLLLLAALELLWVSHYSLFLLLRVIGNTRPFWAALEQLWVSPYSLFLLLRIKKEY